MTVSAAKLGKNIVPVFNDSKELISGQYTSEEINRVFHEQGFVVIRSAIKPEMCELVNSAFDADIKPSSDCFQRQISGNQPHTFTEHGYMKEGLLSIPDLPDSRYKRFKTRFLKITTDDAVHLPISLLFSESGRIMHTMYFEGNAQTPAHRDSHSIDSEEEGRMVGVWIATQDIDPDAGRFFLLEGSHLIETPDSYEGGEWGQRITNWVADSGLRLVAPVMSQGDMILFHSFTVHGSLPTKNPIHSRRSVTCHYIPRSHGMTWLKSITHREQKISQEDSKTCIFNGIPVMLHGHKPITQMELWRNGIKLYLAHRIRILTGRK